MRLIHRYIFREVFSPTLIGLTAYTLVLLMNRIFQLAELAIRKSISPVTVGLLIAYSLPRLLALTLPMAVLLGILVGIGRLAADSEVVALRAGGVSRSAFVYPVLLLTLPAMFLSMADLVWLEPEANYRAHQIYSTAIRQSDAATRIRPGAFYDTIPGTVLYAMGAEPESNELTHLFLYRELADGTEEVTLAARGSIRYNRRQDRLELSLSDSWTHTFPAHDQQDYHSVMARKRQVLLPADPALRARLDLLDREVPKNYAELGLRELRDKYREAGGLVHPLAVQRVQGTIRTIVHEKFAIPTASVVFGLFALGLGLRVRRAGKTSGFAISIVVIIVYWVIYTTGRNFSARGILPPSLGLWVGNLLFLMASVFLLLRRERPPRIRPTGFRFLRVGFRRKPALPQRIGNPRGPYSRISLLSLVDEYVLWYYLRAFLFVCTSLYVIFLLLEFRELVDELIENGQPFYLLWVYILNRFPWTIQQMLPMASLIACVTALGLLSRNHETIALQAAGVSLYRIAAPVIVATMGICGLSYLLQDHVLPYTNREAMAVKDRIRNREPRSYRDPTARWILVRDREIVNYRNYRRGPQEFQGLSIYRFDPDRFVLESRLFAQRARFHSGNWFLDEGWIRDMPPDGRKDFQEFRLLQVPDPDFPREIFTAGYRFPFSFLPDAAKTTSEQMPFFDLRKYIQQLQHGNYNVQELEVALYTKVSFPMIPLVMVLIGVPFAFRAGRRGTMVGLGMSLLLVLLYYAFFAVLEGLGNSGFLPPALAAWGPNLLFAAGAVFKLAHMKS